MAKKRQRSVEEVADSYDNIKDFHTDIPNLEIYLKIVKEVGDRAIEANVYCKLGNAYHSVGDFHNAIECHNRHLKLSKELGDRAAEGKAYGNLGEPEVIETLFVEINIPNGKNIIVVYFPICSFL